MKKIFIILIAFFLTNSAYSQLKVNLQAGVNISNLTDFDLEGLPADFPLDLSTSTVPGFIIGGNIQIGSSFYFQPGVYWHTLGNELNIEELDLSDVTSDNVIARAIQIPVFIGYRLINTGLFNLRLYAGGSLLLITDVNENEFEIIFNGQPFNVSVTKDDFNDQVFGVVGGAGIDFLIFSLDVNYERGISDFIDTEIPLGLTMIPAKAKNNIIRVTAGLRL